jgi:hypothetical protein
MSSFFFLPTKETIICLGNDQRTYEKGQNFIKKVLRTLNTLGGQRKVRFSEEVIVHWYTTDQILFDEVHSSQEKKNGCYYKNQLRNNHVYSLFERMFFLPSSFEDL